MGNSFCPKTNPHYDIDIFLYILCRLQRTVSIIIFKYQFFECLVILPEGRGRTFTMVNVTNMYISFSMFVTEMKILGSELSGGILILW